MGFWIVGQVGGKVARGVSGQVVQQSLQVWPCGFAGLTLLWGVPRKGSGKGLSAGLPRGLGSLPAGTLVRTEGELK